MATTLPNSAPPDAPAGFWPARVYFDGQCPLCSREVNHYRARDQWRRIVWVDIAEKNFNAAAEGLDPAEVNRQMHAKTADGTLYTAVNAFRFIWRALPPTWWTRLALGILSVPGAMPIAGIFYRLFAKNRYRLTGRCTPESCAVGGPTK